jgi:cytochrome c oxidase subunit 3
MSSAVFETPPLLGWDRNRGTWGMWMFIASEAALFLVLFFAYFYLGRDAPRWPPDEPPKVALASIMMMVLLTSSGVIEWARRALRPGRRWRVRGAIAVSIALGIAFLGLQVADHGDRLRVVTPRTDAYGSIFYAITTIHGAHVVLGVLMLVYLLALPRLEPSDRPPHRPFHAVSLYWHFVGAAWLAIVALLYVLPRLHA